MNREQMDVQRIVLARAAADSPLGIYAGPLRHQAGELAKVLKAWDYALGDEIDERRLEAVAAGALTPGVLIYWPNVGAGSVIRTSFTGGQVTGIYVEWNDTAPDWVNVFSSASPVLVINPAPLEAQPDGNGHILVADLAGDDPDPF